MKKYDYLASKFDLEANAKRCECGKPTRTIIDKSEPVYTKVPEPTAGHKHGFVYMYPSRYALDGRCKLCQSKYLKGD
jgi:hypothetical protein